MTGGAGTTHGGSGVSISGGSHTAGGAGAGGGKVAHGQTVSQTRSGGSVTKRADGKVASVHDPKRGVDVHRGLNGNRTVVAERADHSRVVVEHGGHGYVQRPYSFHGHEYARRSYYYHGRYYHAYYGRYYYRGMYINPYYPSYYYGPAFYGWAYNPWVAPVSFGWGWGGSPWFGFYGGFFTPYPVYATPALWLTDYMIANSLQAEYQAQQEANAQAAMSNPAPLTPDVKQQIADEVRRQIALENSESQGAANGEPDASSSSIQRDLSDGSAHVFVAGADLDVVDGSGTECAISQGDALQLSPGQNDPNATSINLAVLASKGGRECPKGDTVAVQLQDLQDMQNSMRMTIDQGLQELQKKQGTGGLPAAPPSATAPPVETAMAQAAPPPPSQQEVAAQLSQESKDADAAEQDANAEAGATGASASAGGPPPTVAMGQTTDQVTSELGQPKSIMDLGPKKIYIYQDMKVTFKGGKVSDIQ
jgi:hypothetical protein